MKESIGMTTTINIMVIFIVVAFVFIAGIISYNKGFKTNSRIINSIEKYEGYNKLAENQINNDLHTIGYRHGDTKKCPNSKNAPEGFTGGDLVTNGDENYEYCVYYFETKEGNSNTYYYYGVQTYINIDFSMFNINIKLPLYAKTRTMYKFG